ncbi:putative hydrolase of the HAD superfamily [Paenibacillus phyllosphaerae]|uniref:Putative hydrolase of the HAD superfamily n=1 Tax=Paenibacillus phyllosphaerae TaxID=274593 RepID=A0A7W5AXF9_9BACL|nr:HAD-IA family hydrolase [Paenibacillus phyllosphaerae]MBB3110565.1 putative hydrolase of the HAD superfamily [Paenibacillus phyllosphaerae]
MVKAVVFDLDDTLISERRYIESGFRHISKILSARYRLNEQEISQLLIELFESSPKNVFNRVLEQNGIPYTPKEIADLIESYREHTPDICFYDDVLLCLRQLKQSNVKLGIITDGYANAQYQKLLAINAFDCFDEIIITDQLGREYWKPHPRAFEMMKERMNLSYSEMVYVGDNVSKDFVSPNKLGMMSIHMRREKGIYSTTTLQYDAEYYAKYSINSMNELLIILTELAQ